MKLLWTLLIFLAFAGFLLPLTILLGWSKSALPCLLGFVAGIAISTGCLTSLQNRALITLLLGVLILPGLAVYVALLARIDPPTYDASSAVLTPFVAYALASLAAVLILVKVWRSMPAREAQNKAEQGPVPSVTPALKEQRSHEQPSVDKAA